MQRGDLTPRQAAPWASCSRDLASSDRAPAMAAMCALHRLRMIG